MKKIFTLVVVCFIGTMLYGQSISSSVVASAGESVENNGLIVSWTLGELAIETLQSTDLILNQGFHQSYFEITAIDNPTSDNFQLNFYPNPATEYVWIDLQSEEIQSIYVEMFNMDGKLMISEKWNRVDGPQKLMLNNLNSSQYILRVSDGGGKLLQSFKLIKR